MHSDVITNNCQREGLIFLPCWEQWNIYRNSLHCYSAKFDRTGKENKSYYE